MEAANLSILQCHAAQVLDGNFLTYTQVTCTTTIKWSSVMDFSPSHLLIMMQFMRVLILNIIKRLRRKGGAARSKIQITTTIEDP